MEFKKIVDLGLNGPKVLRPVPHFDDRGFFCEAYSEREYRQAGIEHRFVQDNHSFSKKGVLRGMHFRRPLDEGKLVRVVSGTIFDVVVDVRIHSEYFGQWKGVILSEDTHEQLWIPPGFAHGFCVLSGAAHVLYKTTCYYEPGEERGFSWNDSDIGIAWPIANPVLSSRDERAPCFATLLAGAVHA